MNNFSFLGLSASQQSVFYLMNGISHSSSEQKSGAEQINVSISEINIGAQNNAAISEKLSESVRLLTQNAHQLSEMLDNNSSKAKHKDRVMKQPVKRAS